MNKAPLKILVIEDDNLFKQRYKENWMEFSINKKLMIKINTHFW